MVKFLVFMCLSISTLIAHPHTFIELFSNIDSKNDNIKSIHLSWSFDEMTSQLLLMEFDQDFDGKISKDELEYIKYNYFEPLDKYNFYTNIKIKNETITTKPENFQVKIKDMKIYYEFDVTIDSDKKDVQLGFYDQEMFTAFMIKDNFIQTDLKFDIVQIDRDYFGYRLNFN